MSKSVRHNLYLPRATDDELPDGWNALGHSDGWAWFSDGEYICRVGLVDGHTDGEHIQGYFIQLFVGGQSAVYDETALLYDGAVPSEQLPLQVTEHVALGYATGLMDQATVLEQATLEYC